MTDLIAALHRFKNEWLGEFPIEQIVLAEVSRCLDDFLWRRKAGNGLASASDRFTLFDFPS